MIAIDITVRDDVRQFSETIFLKVPEGVDEFQAANRAAEFIESRISRSRERPIPPGVEIVGEVYTKSLPSPDKEREPPADDQSVTDE